uniref:Uncharacterized protein n=1 Tax=Knipowitschia caucasica TaxID=637954 RepID=A0AAV2IYZ8_KNICA
MENRTLCGSNGKCINEPGSFICECFPGYRLDPGLDPYLYDPCPDIDECSENPDICIPLSFCVNKPGTYTCACSDRYFPSTGIIWTQDTVCETVETVLNKPHQFEKLTKEKAFFAKMDRQLKENSGKPIHEVSVGNAFSTVMEVAGVGPYIDPPKVSSAGDGETGSIILDLAEGLVAALLVDKEEQTAIAIKTPTLDLDVVFLGPNDIKPSGFSLVADGVTVAINLEQVANNNNGSAAVAFMKLKGLENLLTHLFFETENLTDFGSDIFSVSLPTMSNTNLSDPVNFTVQHTKTLPESGLMTCTYWVSDKSPPPESDFLDWLNRICVSIGLFFFALAILTFLLCSWNPKINNTARLHLCINLGLSHLLLLFNESFFVDKLACKAIAGILHFLVVSSFVWMLLEAVQLYMLVRRLNKVQVIERDGLPQYVLYPVGYGVPVVVVGVSALVYHPGYGGTEAGA